MRATWLIEQHDDRSISVTRNGRPVATGLRSVDNAHSIVGRTAHPRDRVLLVEPDGYRTDLSKVRPSR